TIFENVQTADPPDQRADNWEAPAEAILALVVPVCYTLQGKSSNLRRLHNHRNLHQFEENIIVSKDQTSLPVYPAYYDLPLTTRKYIEAEDFSSSSLWRGVDSH